MKKPSDRILEKFSVAMARGTLVVDENVAELAAPLIDMNIHVVQPPKGMPDHQIVKLLLPNRIIVTKNSKDFVMKASSYDFGIVALDSIKFIDPEPNSELNKTVNLISEAMIKYSLWSKRHGFIIRLRDNGKHKYEELTY